MTQYQKQKKDNKNKRIKNDVNKETVVFLRHIDYARVRGFDLRQLLKHEIVPVSFYLTKDGLFRKSVKSELTKGLKGLLKKKYQDFFYIMINS